MGVKLPKSVLQQVEELEEGIIKEEILPALSSDIAPRLNPIQRDLVLEYHPGEPISVALSRKTKISEMTGAKVLTPRSSTPVKSEEEPEEVKPIRKKTDQNLDVWIIVCIFAAEIDKKNEQRRFLGIRTYNHFRGLHS